MSPSPALLLVSRNQASRGQKPLVLCLKTKLQLRMEPLQSITLQKTMVGYTCARQKILLDGPLTQFNSWLVSRGLFHLEKFPVTVKVNRTWVSGCFSGKFPGSNGASEKVVLFFPGQNIRNGNCVPFQQSHFWYLFQSFAVVFWSMELICANGKQDSGTKFNSPEFCLAFAHAQTVKRPVCPWKWWTTTIY